MIGVGMYVGWFVVGSKMVMTKKCDADLKCRTALAPAEPRSDDIGRL